MIMKKVLLLIAILTIILAVFCGCGSPVPGKTTEPRNDTEYQMLLNSGRCFVYTFKDEKTGVWYIVAGDGVTPRLNADGSLYTEKDK